MIKTFLLGVVCFCAVHAQYSAICKISEDTGSPDEDIHGIVTLTQNINSGEVTIEVDLEGFNEDDENLEHGFHIHTDGDMSDACRGAGGHFNPHGADHGSPTDDNRHVGDLGNIMEIDGEVHTTIVDDSGLIQLHPDHEHTVIGRAIVVHEGRDDLGQGGDEESLKTGNAGGRMACCIIEEAQPVISAAPIVTISTFIVANIVTMAQLLI